MKETSIPLRIRVADTFLRRLAGLYAGGPLASDEALLLEPCRAIHTFFLREPIDVVFLDIQGRECRCVHSLPPYRLAVDVRATRVVELPGGYCWRHPDYLQQIHAALRLRGGLRLPG